MTSSPGAPRQTPPRFSSDAKTMLRIDHWVGVPVCFVFTAIRRVLDLFRRSLETAPCRSILFLKLAEQGSTVLAYDALRTAVAKVGRENVYFLAFEENRFVVDVLGLIPEANVLTVQTRSAWSMMTTILRRLREIRRRRIDVCIDMEFFARASAAITFLTGAKRRIGFHGYFGESPYRGDLLTHRVLYNPHLHTNRTFTGLVRALDLDPRVLPTFNLVLDPPSPLPLFRPAEEESLAMRAMIRELGVPSRGRLILLNANASDLLPLRRWDERNYVALAQRLLAEFPELYVGFTGAPEEARAIGELARRRGLAPQPLPGRTHDAAPAAGGLRPGRASHHQRQRAGPFCGPDQDRRRRALRAGNPAVVRGARPAEPSPLGGARLQPVHQRVQYPADRLSRQCLHEKHHRGSGLCQCMPDLSTTGGATGVNPAGSKRWLPVALLLALGAAVFSPAFHGRWLWDDGSEIFLNPALRTAGGPRPGAWIAPDGPDYFR